MGETTLEVGPNALCSNSALAANLPRERLPGLGAGLQHMAKLTLRPCTADCASEVGLIRHVDAIHRCEGY